MNPDIFLINQSWNLLRFNINNGVAKTFGCVNNDDKTQVSLTPTFKRISIAPTCAWALGCEEKLYVCVFKTDAPIKVTVECYENNRWSIRYGWSVKSMLFTDRWVWSSKDGKQHLLRDSFKLPSDAWVWERGWSVDTNIDCDIDGWQYAMDFPAHYHKSMSKLSFVRRRKWSRNRIFCGFDQWFTIESPAINDPVQDVSVGGHELPYQTEGYHITWVVTLQGKVFYRMGITRESPEGTDWHCVPVNPDINLVHISVGPTGLVWGCTWSGQSVIRLGVSFQMPAGHSWCIIEPPTSCVIMQVAVGINCVWALTTNRKIFFRKSVTTNYKKTPNSLEYPCGASWVELIGKFSLISVGPREQLWAIGYEDEELYYRTHISSVELMGREWQKISLTKSDIAHCLWLHAGSCFIGNDDLVKLSQPKKFETPIGKWRNELLTDLQERNLKTRELYKEEYMAKDSAQEEEVFVKQVECLLQLNSYYDLWCNCYLKLLSYLHDDEMHESLLFYYKEKDNFKESCIPLKSITCVHRIYNPARCFTFKLQQSFISDRNFIISFDAEKEFVEWLNLLNESFHKIENFSCMLKPFIQSENCSDCSKSKKILNSEHMLSKLYITSDVGSIYKTENFSIQHHNCLPHWRPLDGFMSKVVCGYDNILWGISFDGRVFVFDKHCNSHEQNCVTEYCIHENERWNPIEGYSSRLLPSDRWQWSDSAGLIKCSKDCFQLPSKMYQWTDDWCIAYDNDCDNDGWQYAADFPRIYHKWRGVNDYVRRRKWKRSCKVNFIGPWIEVPTDARLIDISITMTSPVAVWVVTSQGNLLIRLNVDETCPEGDGWKHVSTASQISSVSVGLNNRVWCASREGVCFIRGGFKKQPVYGTRWLETSKDDIRIEQIAVGGSLVLAIDEKGILHTRTNINPAYPEGTSWSAVVSDVSYVSVNSLDEVYIIQNGEVKVLSIADGNPVYTMTLLTGDWLSICCYVTSPQEPDLQKDLPDTTDIKDSPDPVSDHACVDETGTENEECSIEAGSSIDVVSSPIGDPYSVDIYSMFSADSDDEDISSYLNDFSISNS